MTVSVESATCYGSSTKDGCYDQDDVSSFEKPEETTRKLATWIEKSVSAEKRTKLRSLAAFEVDICPLNEKLEPAQESQPGMILNFSNEGVCLEHVVLIPEQYVSISWSDSHQQKHVAIVHLKWCRSTQDRKILSGGRVCSMKTLP